MSIKRVMTINEIRISRADPSCCDSRCQHKGIEKQSGMPCCDLFYMMLKPDEDSIVTQRSTSLMNKCGSFALPRLNFASPKKRMKRCPQCLVNESRFDNLQSALKVLED